MATSQLRENRRADVNGKPSAKDQGTSKSTRRPVRSFMEDLETSWRYGAPPDYSTVNADYMAGRTRQHAAGSLEEIVENLVKTWEMEQTHKVNPEQWQTVDCSNYQITVNGSKSYNIEDVKRMGTYNMLLMESMYYDAKKHTYQSSHDLFKEAFDRSFPFEVLEVFSGPPTVAFTWRHWGRWKGRYGEVAPSGELVELFGFCKATVTDDQRIKTIDIFFDPNPFLLTFFKGSASTGCPIIVNNTAL